MANLAEGLQSVLRSSGQTVANEEWQSFIQFTDRFSVGDAGNVLH